MVGEHRCDIRPQGLEIKQYTTEHAGREWWVVNERGERLVRIRWCPWCGSAL